MPKQKPGISYLKRAAEINRIYDHYAKTGVSNREIWRRYVYPVYGISERTFYNILKAPPTKTEVPSGLRMLSLFDLDELAKLQDNGR